jgi:hypothetical protein
MKIAGWKPALQISNGVMKCRHPAGISIPLKNKSISAPEGKRQEDNV